MLGGRAGNGRDQSRVVDQLTVVGEQTAGQPIAAHCGREFDGAVRSIGLDRGSVDDGVPESLRSPSPATKPNRTSARDALFIDGNSGTSCGMALTRWGALRVIRIPRSIALRRAIPILPVARYRSPPCTSFAAPSAGAEGEVVLLDQRDTEPPRRGVQRDADAGDAAADHDGMLHGVAVGQRREFGGAACVVERRGTGHFFRYPFNVWASSTASASASRIGATICPDWIAGLGDQQAHGGELTGIAGPHAALLLRQFDLGGDRVEEYLLAGAQLLGDVDHHELGRAAQHRHHHFIAAQPLGDSDDPLDQRLSAHLVALHVVQRADDPRWSAAPPVPTGYRAIADRPRPAHLSTTRDLGQRHPVHTEGQHAVGRRGEIRSRSSAIVVTD